MARTFFEPATVRPGEKAWGYINVIDSLAVSFDMPVMVVNGTREGPTFTVTAGLYPLEYCGIEASSRLYRQIDPNGLRGKVMIVPVVNMPVFQFRTPMFSLSKSLSPMERSVLQMLADGKSVHYIAHQQQRSDRSVSRYISELMKKLNATSLAHAVAIGFRKHIIV